MSNVAKIDLRLLSKAIDGRSVNFILDADGEPLPDEKGRERIAGYISSGFPVIPMRQDDAADDRPDPSHSRLNRLKESLAKLRRESYGYISRLQSPPAKLQAKMQALEDEISECENRVPRSLSKLIPKEQLVKSGIVPAIVKMHIACDYLAECTDNVRDIFKALNLQDQNLLGEVNAVYKKAFRFASAVCHPEYGDTSDLLTDDTTLIDDINTLVGQYLKNHK